MNIRNVGTNGSVERSSDRTKGGDVRHAVLVPAPRRDDARISASSLKTAAAVEGLAERARNGGGDRDAKIAAAEQKLLAGELDQPAVLAETARRVLDARFLSA